MTADRNLLFGILALQIDFVGRDPLVAAMNAWVLAKHRPLGDILRERGALGEDEHALLEALVAAPAGPARRRRREEPGGARPVAFGPRGPRRRRRRRRAGQPGPPRARRPSPESTAAYVPGPDADGVRFRILRPHAKGGLGEVFVAEDAELHREVALKEIQDRARRRRRQPRPVPAGGRDHRRAGAPGHRAGLRPGPLRRRPAVLRHALHQGRQPQGGHRRASTGRRPGATWRASVAFRQLLGRFVDVCNAVAYAHSRGVLHRDLKPGNVMLGKYGETLVVDWGLAKVVGRGGEPRRRRGRRCGRRRAAAWRRRWPGTAVGTPAYMSPEQAAGRLDQLGPASDVYSLGATLYCLLTGRPPVSGGDVGEVLEKVQRGDFPPPRQVRPGVPPALEAVCLKAMALRPGDRYPSALALAADVEHWLADEPVSGLPRAAAGAGRRAGRGSTGRW